MKDEERPLIIAIAERREGRKRKVSRVRVIHCGVRSVRPADEVHRETYKRADCHSSSSPIGIGRVGGLIYEGEGGGSTETPSSAKGPESGGGGGEGCGRGL